MMASHAPTRIRPRVDPLSAVLATIPSLPRPVLARLTARMIDRLDEIDGDADNEQDEDRCEAGDDEMSAGASPACRHYAPPYLSKDDDDAEGGSWPEGLDHGRSPIPDDNEEDDAPDLRHSHRDRLRATRCDVRRPGGRFGPPAWSLRDAKAREVMGLVP